MLQGALIGLIVGVVMVLVVAKQRKSATLKVAAALDGQGREAARALIDKTWKQATKVGGNQILNDRMAALALVGDVASLRRECDGLQGGFAAPRALVKSTALLGILVRGSDAERRQAAADLDALAGEIDRARVIRGFKLRIQAVAALGHALLGEPLRAEHHPPLLQAAREKSLTGLLHAHALALAFRATGMAAQAAELEARVRETTKAFDQVA